MKRSTPLKRGKPLRRRTQLRAKPSGRARPTEPLAEECEARLPGCTGSAEHRHHRLRRSQGGSDDRTNTIDICAADHAHIHRNVAWAYEHGWLRKRTA